MKEIIVENIKDLIEYKQSKKMSAYAWDTLNSMDDEYRLIMGQPFVKSVDSIGVNIVKGFNEVDMDKKISYYEDSITDLSEALDHWVELMLKRNAISKITFRAFKELESPMKIKLKSRVSSLTKNRK
jgi:four helix bundle protein